MLLSALSAYDEGRDDRARQLAGLLGSVKGLYRGFREILEDSFGAGPFRSFKAELSQYLNVDTLEAEERLA